MTEFNKDSLYIVSYVLGDGRGTPMAIAKGNKIARTIREVMRRTRWDGYEETKWYWLKKSKHYSVLSFKYGKSGVLSNNYWRFEEIEKVFL